MTTPPSTAPGRWAAWVALLDTREPATSLALFRLACGLVICGAVGSVLAHGLVPVLWLDAADGGHLETVNRPWLFELLGGVTPRSVWAMTLTALAAGALLALGLGGRVTAFVALQSYLAVTDLNGLASGGDDRLLVNALWLLVLARATATLSLDCRLRIGRWASDEAVPAWPRYLLIVQLVIVYAAAGWQKISEDWLPGGEMSALYYILQIPSWQRYGMAWLARYYPLTQLATAVTWFFEAGAPLLLLALWYRRTAERPGWLRALFNRLRYRDVFVAVGVSLHVGIMLLMNVEPFSWVALSYYLCLFRPEEWRALARRLGLAGGGAEAAAARPPAGWWPHVRAVLVAAHLVAVTAPALPAPQHAALEAEVWRKETVRRELAAWSRRLGRVGVEATPAELEARARRLCAGWVAARDVVLRPFGPYYTYCGTDQSWKLFTGAPHEASRLCVDVREGGQWRAVFIERDEERAWLGGLMGHHRVRPVVMAMSDGLFPDEYRQFAAWLARRAAADFPGADAVRVRYVKARIPTAAEARAGQRPAGEDDQVVVLPLR